MKHPGHSQVFTATTSAWMKPQHTDVVRGNLVAEVSAVLA